MNRLHQWLCASSTWAQHVQRTLVPRVLACGTLGDDVLETGTVVRSDDTCPVPPP